MRQAFQETTLGKGIGRGALAALAVLASLAAGLPTAFAQGGLSMPKSPVTINIVDVAGQLQMTQSGFEAYRTKYPDRVARFTYTKAPAPELASKLKAMQSAGRVDIDMVLTGTDGLAAGVAQGLWTRLLPDYAAQLPGVLAAYQPAARKMQNLAQGQGLLIVFSPGGPLLYFNPDKVKTPPKTPQELLAWCKANPNRFIYARPANSGPGRTFLMGLPYLLKDKNPKDPIGGWDKTWAFLKELGTCIEYYPTGTGITMKEFGEGSRDMTVAQLGWDINTRVLGTVPKNFKTAFFQNTHFVDDGQFMAIPKGVPADKLAVLLDLMAFMLKPEQQALTYDDGYFYPGPAVKNAPLSMAPKKSQDTLAEFGRPEYDVMIAKLPHELPLDDQAMVAAFKKWDEDVGAQQIKK